MRHDNLQVIISPHICLVVHRSAWCDKDVGGEEMNLTQLIIDLEAESHTTLWHILKIKFSLCGFFKKKYVTPLGLQLIIPNKTKNADH